MNPGSATTTPGSRSNGERSAPGRSLLDATPMGLVEIALLGILLIAVASATTWAVAGELSGTEANGPGDAFVAGSALLASILTLIAALRRWRLGVAVAPWLGMTIACHVWLVGAVSGIVIQFYLGHVLTVPSLVDIPLLAFAPIVVWSFRPMFRRQRDGLGRAGVLLDGAIVGLLAVVAVVTPILGDRVAGNALSPGDRTVVMLWLLSAVLVVLPAIPIALTSPRHDRFWVWPIAAGVAFLGIGQAIHANALRQDVASMSHPIALCWSIGFLLVAVAAVFGGWQSRAVAERQSTGGSLARWLVGFGAFPVLRTGSTVVSAGVIGLTLLLVSIQEDLGFLATTICVVAVAAITTRIVLGAVQTDRLLRSAASVKIERRLEFELRSLTRPGTDPIAALEQAVASALGFREVHLLQQSDQDGLAGAAADTDPDVAGESVPEAVTVQLTIDGNPIGTGRFTTDGEGPPSRTQLDALVVAGPWIGLALRRAQHEAATLRRREMVARLSGWLRDDAGHGPSISLEGRLERVRRELGAAGSRLERWDPVAGVSRVVVAAGSWDDARWSPGIEEVRSLAVGPSARFFRCGSTSDPVAILLGLLSPAGATPVTLSVVWDAGAGPVTDDQTDDLVALTLLNLVAAGFAAPMRTAQLPERHEAVRQRALRVLSHAGDRQAALGDLTRAALTAGGVSHAAILLWAPISDEYEVATMLGRSGARSLFISGERSSLAMLPTVRRVLESRETIAGFTTEAPLTPAEAGLFEEAGAVALALVPIVRGERCFGALVLASGEIEPFPEETLTLFAELAGATAVAIERDRAITPVREDPGPDRAPIADGWAHDGDVADDPGPPR